MRVRRRRTIGYEWRIVLASVIAILPPIVAALLLVWLGPWSDRLGWTVTVFLGLSALIALLTLHEHVVHPLRTLSNILAALREEDYSIRSRTPSSEDALGEVLIEVNELSAMLRERRLDAMEATALMGAVISEIESAIFVFDRDHRLRLVNRAGERLLALNAERLIGLLASELGLDSLLEGETAGTLERTFPGGSGRFGFRRSQVREKGHPHQLLVVADLSRALREEERQAWQRLVRVLGHELNNSLTPIKSISGSLERVVARDPLPEDWREDVERGLAIISSRAEALTRFMSAYARLARLPSPTLGEVELGPLVTRIAALEQRMPIKVEEGPRIALQADAAQLEQLLINLLRNAVDAALETGGDVVIGWSRRGGAAEIEILDEGSGIAGGTNLFVPFYTTKPGGSGIGLVLSRQIAEAHGGSLNLSNREDRRGCEAILRLPLQ
ncbi:MAG TPA: ATP-binding protein [Thermoanaerobaculia bacterium]|nr:ATP-binding protein [Thermoanaerobaculia bacterium]